MVSCFAVQYAFYILGKFQDRSICHVFATSEAAARSVLESQAPYPIHIYHVEKVITYEGVVLW